MDTTTQTTWHQRLRFGFIMLLYAVWITCTALLACKWPFGSWQFDLVGISAASGAFLAKLSPGSIDAANQKP